MLFFINYKHFDSFMASKLFKIKKPGDVDLKSKTYFERSNFFRLSKFRNFRYYVMDSLPSWLKVCKETR